MLSSKFLKKLSLGLVLTLTVSGLAGCGNKATDADKEPAEDAAQTSGSEIIIGGNLELTGNTASFGASAKKAIEMAVEEVNANGGVNGAKLKFVTADNKSEPTEATNAISKLISKDKAVVAIGPLTSTSTIAAATIATQYKVPMISPTGTNPAVTVENGGVKDYVFRTCFIDPFQGKVGADFASKDLKAKKAAILADSSSDYSKGLAQVFKDTFTQAGGQVVAEEAFVAKDTDFKATLTNIKSTNPDVIYVPAYYEEVGKIIRQARELGMNQPFLGGDGFDSNKLVEIAGAKNLNQVFFTNHYSADSTSEKAQNFLKNYQAKYGEKPDAFAALGYDSVYMIVDSITRGGSAEPEAIKNALAELKDLELVTGKISMDANHNPIKSAVIIELVDGVQKYKTTVNP